MIIEARDDVVKLEGSLDKNLWPTIQAAANLLLRQHIQGIIVDGSGLTGCSPEGAQTFGDAINYIERYRARIVFCGLPENVMAVARTVPGVRSRLSVAASVEEARASLNLSRPDVEAAAAKGRSVQEVMVPLLRADMPENAAALACRLAQGNGAKARIHLSYILEVPRNLPLTAPLPEEEAAARRVLESSEMLVRREGLAAVPHVTRVRDAGEEIIHQAKDLGVAMIVLAYAPPEDPADDLMTRVIKTVIDRAPCEVVLNKLPA